MQFIYKHRRVRAGARSNDVHVDGVRSVSKAGNFKLIPASEYLAEQPKFPNFSLSREASNGTRAGVSAREFVWMGSGRRNLRGPGGGGRRNISLKAGRRIDVPGHDDSGERGNEQNTGALQCIFSKAPYLPLHRRI